MSIWKWEIPKKNYWKALSAILLIVLVWDLYTGVKALNTSDALIKSQQEEINQTRAALNQANQNVEFMNKEVEKASADRNYIIKKY